MGKIYKIGLAILMLFFAVKGNAQDQGNVIIHADPRLDVLFKKHNQVKTEASTIVASAAPAPKVETISPSPEIKYAVQEAAKPTAINVVPVSTHAVASAVTVTAHPLAANANAITANAHPLAATTHSPAVTTHEVPAIAHAPGVVTRAVSPSAHPPAVTAHAVPPVSAHPPAAAAHAVPPVSAHPAATAHAAPVISHSVAATPRPMPVIASNREGSKLYSGKGFRVQIYNGQDREKAIKIKTEFMRHFPAVRSYLTYVAPSFRVKVGDYRFRNEAESMLKEAKSINTPCMIVPDVITVHTF